MVYIWAWHAAECPPDLLISSMITLAWVRPRPRPPYSVGMSADEQAGAGEGVDELLRVAAVEVGLAPVLVGELRAQVAGLLAQLLDLDVG